MDVAFSHINCWCFYKVLHFMRRFLALSRFSIGLLNLPSWITKASIFSPSIYKTLPIYVRLQLTDCNSVQTLNFRLFSNNVLPTLLGLPYFERPTRFPYLSLCNFPYSNDVQEFITTGGFPDKHHFTIANDTYDGWFEFVWCRHLYCSVIFVFYVAEVLVPCRVNPFYYQDLGRRC